MLFFVYFFSYLLLTYFSYLLLLPKSERCHQNKFLDVSDGTNIQSDKKFRRYTKLSFATKTQCFQFKELINMSVFVFLCNGSRTMLWISQNTHRSYSERNNLMKNHKVRRFTLVLYDCPLRQAKIMHDQWLCMN